MMNEIPLVMICISAMAHLIIMAGRKYLLQRGRPVGSDWCQKSSIVYIHGIERDANEFLKRCKTSYPSIRSTL